MCQYHLTTHRRHTLCSCVCADDRIYRKRNDTTLMTIRKFMRCQDEKKTENKIKNTRTKKDSIFIWITKWLNCWSFFWQFNFVRQKKKKISACKRINQAINQQTNEWTNKSYLIQPETRPEISFNFLSIVCLLFLVHLCARYACGLISREKANAQRTYMVRESVHFGDFIPFHISI